MWYSDCSFASADRVRARHFMPCRPAVLLTPPRDLSNSSLFCTLLQKSEAHSLTFQSLPGSLHKHRGCQREYLFLFNFSALNSQLDLTPLDATLTANFRVLPCFGRSCPRATPLDATLTDSAPVTPLSATLTKSWGGGSLPHRRERRAGNRRSLTGVGESVPGFGLQVGSIGSQRTGSLR